MTTTQPPKAAETAGAVAATRWSASELMIVNAARRLRDGDRVFVGVGQPNLACNLARRLHAPNLVMIYESGVIGAQPSRLPLSIGDPCLVPGATSVLPMFDGFAFYLQGGLLDVGFLGGAQVDRWGNINATVIGDYHHPKVRLPGSGGACEVAANAEQIYILTRHTRQRFPAKVDFITSPGFVGGREGRRRLGLIGGGPHTVITDLALLEFDAAGEMFVAALHPGATLDQVRANTAWEIKVATELGVTEPPTEHELRLLREELDPTGIYLGGKGD